MDNATQCVIVKTVGDIRHVMVSWIPSRFAVTGKTLKLKQNNDEWTDGWLVTDVGATLPYDVVNSRERDYTKQRTVSDV